MPFTLESTDYQRIQNFILSVCDLSFSLGESSFPFSGLQNISLSLVWAEEYLASSWSHLLFKGPFRKSLAQKTQATERRTQFASFCRELQTLRMSCPGTSGSCPGTSGLRISHPLGIIPYFLGEERKCYNWRNCELAFIASEETD